MRRVMHVRDSDGSETCLGVATINMPGSARSEDYQPKLNIPLIRAIRNAAYVRSLSPEDQQTYWLQHQQNLAEAQQTRIGGSL